MLLLTARVLVVVLFLLFGYERLTAVGPTVTYLASTDAPVPVLATVIAIVVEVLGSALILIGYRFRPLALFTASTRIRPR